MRVPRWLGRAAMCAALAAVLVHASDASAQQVQTTQVDLPKEGETVRQAEVFGSVESVKAVSDLFAPLTGKVVKVNSPLADSPEYVNEDPYDEGWMIQIAIANPKELDGLLDAEAYQAFLREQGE